MSIKKLNTIAERQEWRDILTLLYWIRSIIYLQNSNLEREHLKINKCMNNRLLQDMVFIKIDTEWERCRKILNYDHVLEGSRKSGFFWVKCLYEITPKIKVSVGASPSTAIYGIGASSKEEQLLMTEKELRIIMNAFYDNVQNQMSEKTFDIMIFREIRGQLFWNWIFYFIHYNLPYDWILPYINIL